jgi:hypothetical protein
MNDRTPSSDGRPELVTHEIEWKIERRDGGNDPDWHTKCPTDRCGANARARHRYDFTDKRSRLDRRCSEGVARPIHLGTGQRDRLARFIADGSGKCVGTLLKQHHSTIQHGCALAQWVLSAKRLVCNANLTVDIDFAHSSDFAEPATIKRGSHDNVIRLPAHGYSAFVV